MKETAHARSIAPLRKEVSEAEPARAAEPPAWYHLWWGTTYGVYHGNRGVLQTPIWTQ
jgi:hypothetical protein